MKAPMTEAPIRFLVTHRDKAVVAPLVTWCQETFKKCQVVRKSQLKDIHQVAAQAPFDLIFVDHFLDDAAGIDILQILPHQPVIVITRTGDQAAAVAAFRQGADDYIYVDEDGDWLRYLDKSVRNALQRKRKEDVLRDSERFLRALIGNVPGLVFQQVLRQDGSIHYPFMTAGSIELLGFDPEEVRNNPEAFQRLAHPDELKGIIESVVSSAKSLVQWNHDLRIVTRNGQEKWLRGSARPRRLENGDTQWDGLMLDITELRNTQEALSREKELSEGILQSIADPFFAVDGDWMVHYRNKAANILLGGAPEAEEQQLWDLNPELSSFFFQGLRQVMRNRHPHTFEAYFSPTDRWYAVHAAPFFAGVSAYCRDITERKLAETALREREESLQAIMDNMVDGVLTFDETGLIRSFSPSAEALYSYRAGDLVDKENVRILIPDEYFGEETSIHGFLPGPGKEYERIESLEVSGVRADGTLWPMELSIGYTNIAGETRYIAVVRDISQRKESDHLIRSQREHLAAIMNNMIDAVVTVDEEGIIDSFSASASAMFGYAPEEVIGKPVDIMLPPVEERLLAKSFLEFRQSIWDGERYQGRGESRWARKDGSLIPLEFSMSEMDIDGRRYFVAVLRDVSDRKRQEAARQELEDNLNQARKMQSLGQLAGGIAHDFNNMLFAMLGLSEVSLRQLPEESPIRGNLEKVIQAGRRSRALVEQILAFSRQERVEYRPLDLCEAMIDSLSLLEATLPSSLRLEKSVPESPLMISGDEGQVQQVLMNLCNNAAYAIGRGQGSISVFLSQRRIDKANKSAPVRHPGDYAVLKVSDTGCGMPQDVIDKIFDPFFTTKGVGEGTGMGLSVVHSIVANHGGVITVSSAINKGTTFTLFFPLVREGNAPSKMADKTLMELHE